MNPIRLAFLLFVAMPLARLFTGADVVDRQRLPAKGPAIIAANHNSHVDTLLLLTIFPLAALGRLRPVAAADYFLKGPMIGWFSRRIIGIVPIVRGGPAAGTNEDVLAPAREALARGDIIIIFPEGTRGDASDAMGRLKAGVARLAEAFPQAPVIPVWLEGAGRVLPKGTLVPVPMNCTVLVGEPLAWCGERTAFIDRLRAALLDLKAKAPPQHWIEDEDPKAA
ncbi:MAG: 1-acyl-sn-glycerol-3-phosphate acyltransferase [Proteobacteria bacterium]|nr:1-acyl-sn-glycerol-3-phosphate acyltransferase [Pseudomonadota bacterium]